MQHLIVLFVLSLVYTNGLSQEMGAKTMGENQSDSGKVTIHAPIVEKTFYNKIGKKTDINEFYIQQSVQDYFIKFCESKVTKEELEKALSEVKAPIKSLKLKVEFREGLWDSCGEEPVQSRTGKYVVIYEME